MTDDAPTARLAPVQPGPADAFPLRELEIGTPDKRGRTVIDILWAVQDFKIYKTDKGISPQFSDDPQQARQQRQDYMALGPELADLNQQINLLNTGWGRMLAWITRKFGASDDPRLAYYERETARGIAQALSGQPDEGRATLADLNTRISKRLSNILRVLYFSICVVATLEIAVGLAIYTKTMTAPETETLLGLNVFELCVAAVMGCLGALLSTAIGLRRLAIDPAATLTINITYAIQRMLVGVLGAVVLHISLKSGIVSNLLGTTASAPAEAGTIYKLAFVSLLAGFSERLVPNLLDRAAETYGKENTTAPPSGGATPTS
ncbi:hypothetical protein [Nisaea sp.]|uniref:hypothetical protein n=1 Tax=Nisaea sp. TaxID=2024842 RepID=UPI0032EBCF67